MQGTPQRNPPGRAVRCNILLGAHGVLIVRFAPTLRTTVLVSSQLPRRKAVGFPMDEAKPMSRTPTRNNARLFSEFARAHAACRSGRSSPRKRFVLFERNYLLMIPPKTTITITIVHFRARTEIGLTAGTAPGNARHTITQEVKLVSIVEYLIAPTRYQMSALKKIYHNGRA